MVNIMNKEGKKYGMRINTGKTKLTVIEKAESGRPLSITIDGVELEQAKEYEYI